MAIKGSIASGDEMMDVTKQILNAGSTAVDLAALVSEVGKELPIASAVLTAFLAVQNNFETVRANKEDLEDMRERCGRLTASVVVRCQGSTTGLDLKPLEACLRDAAEVIKRCGRRKKAMKTLKATSDKGEIENVNKRISNLVIDMGLSGVMAILISNRKGSTIAEESSMGNYGGQNHRAIVWAALYFGVWIIQRLSCNLGLPPNCELASGPLDVLTDLAVLFTFSLVQAWWCEILEADRWSDTVENPWVFIIVPLTAIVVSALEWIRDQELWEYKHPGGACFDFSYVQYTLYTFDLIVVMFFIGWHLIRPNLTLTGSILTAGDYIFEDVKKLCINLQLPYTGSRLVLIVWALLFANSLIVEGEGFNYRGALLAWVLSLIAVFPITVSVLWLCLTTGIFIQGIGSYRLRFLGCHP